MLKETLVNLPPNDSPYNIPRLQKLRWQDVIPQVEGADESKEDPHLQDPAAQGS